MSPDVIPSPLRPYTGPGDNDPLTEDELTLLLAIPRAAESNPDGTLFRLPLGPDPSMGWIDATCAETRSIVVRLADAWKSRLSELLDNSGKPVLDSAVGPGTTICIAANPDFHGIFHFLAFWAMGCTVQYVSLSDPAVAINQLNGSGCKVMLCSGLDDDWVETRKKEFKGVIVQLPKEEQSVQLTRSEKQGKAHLHGLSPGVRIQLSSYSPREQQEIRNHCDCLCVLIQPDSHRLVETISQWLTGTGLPKPPTRIRA